MAKPSAVTAEASAASNSLEDAFETGFLPEDPEYRRTGKMPDKDDASATGQEEDEQELETEVEEESDEKETPAPNDKSDDTAAASETAKTTQEKKEPVTQKTAKTSENRYQKITRENKELREKLARSEGRDEGRQSVQQPTRDNQQATTQTAAEQKNTPPPRPTIDDVDPKTGKAKYSTYAEYETAKDEWLRADVLRTFQESTNQSQRQQQQTEQQRAIVENLNKKFEASRAKHDDFDAVALNKDLIMPMGSVTDLFLQDSEHGGEIAYHLGQHPEILQGFYGDFDSKTGRFTNKITPQQQFRKLMQIEAELSKEKTTPARPVTRAGRPPHQTSGNGSVGKDAIEQALEEDDTDSYMSEANSRDPRLQAVKASRKKG